MARPHGRTFIARRPVAVAIVAWQLLFIGYADSIFPMTQAAAGDNGRRTVESQRREFSISVDGTKRGSLTMQIRRRSDGSILLRSEAELHINVIVYKYAYNSAGSELWKNGRLIAMENVADYNGTQYRVKAATMGKGLRVTVDGVVSQMAPETWLSSYWQTPERLASGELADRTVGEPAAVIPQEIRGERYLSILDSDQGRKLTGKLVRVGDETLAVAGEQRACTHFRITGDVHVDLWYDASGRLVREESLESRHKVRFELSEIAAE
jgi:hypothetical protein